MSASTLLVVIGGAPGTGKTTLARRIGHDLELPVISKDGIKDALFDALGWSDVAWSRKVGVASIAVMFHVAEAVLAAGPPVIVECNFRPELDTARVARLVERTSCVPYQIFCEARPEILMQRFRARWESGARHPGHAEDQQLEEFEAAHLGGVYKPLDIGGNVQRLDTSDFRGLDLVPVLGALRIALEQHATHMP